jgi:hypothetical protein
MMTRMERFVGPALILVGGIGFIFLAVTAGLPFWVILVVGVVFAVGLSLDVIFDAFRR